MWFRQVWVLLLGIGAVIAAGTNSRNQNTHGSNLKLQEPETLSSEGATVSEVEYVDGPLAPLYDFLNQRRLYKFCKLLRDTNLEEELQNVGSYWTLFVPTDTSFVFLPSGTLEDLKRNPQKLKDFLLYHFVTGDFTSSQILNEMLVDSLQGAPLRFNIYQQIMTVSGAQILEPDLEFEQGRVHIVDHPLYRIPVSNTVSYLKTSHPSFYKLISDSGYEEYLSSGPFTILLPEEDAFSYLTEDLKNAVASNISMTEGILLNHVLPGSVYTGGITDGMTWPTINDDTLTFTIKRGLVFVNDIPIILPDVSFTNGVIQTLNRVLLPEGIENDCQCKPSTKSFITSSRQRTARPTQRSQTITTRSNLLGQSPGRFSQNNPTPPQRSPISQTPRPVSPSRATVQRQPSPVTTSAPRLSETQPIFENDLNAVLGPRAQTNPDTRRVTTQDWRRQGRPTPRTNRQPPRHQQQHTRQPSPQISENEVVEDASPVVTNPPRQTSRWVNRQPIQPSRHQTLTRSTSWTRGTTPKPKPNILTTPQSNVDTPIKPVITQTPPVVQTHRPTVQTNSWFQRKQVSVVTHQRSTTTSRSNRFPTPPSVIPQVNPHPFESNRQSPICRQPGERVLPSNQNLPLCSNQEAQCQSWPLNSSDPRPLCPGLEQSGCRRVEEPFDPSDSRPLCKSPLVQGCRNQGDPTYAGDQRPFCAVSPVQTGCRDPSLPRTTNDNRPLCRSTTSSTITPSVLAQSEPKSECRPFNERPKPGDRRSLCRTNNQRPSQQHAHDSNKGNQVPPQRQGPTPPQNNRHSNTHTTRRQTWQSTTRAPQPVVQPIVPNTQMVRVPPQTGHQRNVPPQPQRQVQQPQIQVLQPQRQVSQPQRQPIQIRPQSNQRQPQRGSVGQRPPSQPNSFSTQTNSPFGQGPTSNTQAPWFPSSIFIPTSSPLTTMQRTPLTQNQVTFPQVGVTQPSFINQPVQTPRQPVSPQRRPVQVISQPGRTSSPRIPVGTSTTPGDDSRRTLYEIVEDPSLLIRGHPVKLTKILDLFQKSDIEDILTGPGPSTVFLPSDDAFAMLPKGVIEQLEENPELLRRVLLYHVTNTEVLPSLQSESYTIPSLSGTQLVVTMLNGGRLIVISGAKAIAVTRASNGIFYVINQFLYPLPHEDLVSAIQSRPDLSTFSSLLSSSGLTNMFQGQDAYTILAPTDTAFAQLSPDALNELLQDANALQGLLLNHIVEGAHYGREFLTGVTYPSARGGKLKFQIVSYGYQVNDVNIKTPEIVTGTGVIHLIDEVLLENSDKLFLQKFDTSVTDSIDNPSNGLPQPLFNEFQSNRVTGQQTHTGTQNQQRQPNTNSILPLKPNSNNQISPTGPSPPNVQRFDLRQNNVNSGQRTNGQTVSSGLQPPNGHWTGQRIGQRTPTTQRPTRQHQAQGGSRLSNGVHDKPRPLVSNSINTRQPVSNSINTRQPVLQPQVPGGTETNIADLARSMGLNRFASWITGAGLLEKIHDGGVYTVFAPTDDAIDSLPEDMINSINTNPGSTQSLLHYHIVPRKININSIKNEQTTTTLLQGATIRFNVYSNSKKECHQVVTASGTPIGDAQRTIGSVQVIPVTQVLYQPTGDLKALVNASPILTYLAHAIESAKVSWILSGSGPLTFFAPSNLAFESLSPEEIKAMIEDKQAFSNLIKKHVIRGTYFSTGVQEDVTKNSENGQPLSLSLQNGLLTVNSLPVSYSDITTTNGVLHVIDRFL